MRGRYQQQQGKFRCSTRTEAARTFCNGFYAFTPFPFFLMSQLAIVVHGGAGPDEDFIHENEAGYLAGLRAAADAGYAVLADGGTALDAVQAAVQALEDNPLFNAGCGSALTKAAPWKCALR